MLKFWVSLLLVSGAGLAQESRASISGTVTDSSGAIVPGVSLKVQNVESGMSFTASTNSAGQYRFLFLNPGNYRLSAEALGFRRFERSDILLHVNQSASVDIQLQVGAQTEVITVTGQPPLLETEKADRGLVVDRRRISELPLNNRTPIMLSALATGVLHSGSQQHLVPYANSGLGSWSVNGTTPRNLDFLMDGAPNNMIYGGANSIAYVPSAEAVEEFKVITNIYDAQYGRTGGGVISVSSKSGTNEYHGSAYEFMKRTFLNANTFSNNVRRAPRTGSTQDQYGFTIGGPVRLPRLYNGKDRTFFFFGWEGFHYLQQYPSESITSVPTVEQKRGDFSRTLDTQGRLITIYDPLTGRFEGSTWVRTAFPGNAIPGNRIDPAGAKILALYPDPNTSTAGSTAWQNNFFLQGNLARFDYDNYNARIDHAISDRHRMFGRWSWFPEFESRVVNAIPGPGGDLRTGNKINHGVMLDLVSTLTPATVLNTRVSLNRWLEDKGPHRWPGGLPGWKDSTQIGWPQELVRQLPDPTRPPYFTADLYGTLGTASGQTNFEPTNVFSVQPNVTLIRGKHTVKTGLDFRVTRYVRYVSAYAGGRLDFDRAFTRRDYLSQDALSGSSAASMLLGYPSGGIIDNNVRPLWQFLYYAPWVQDDIKLTRRLTVNFGLRWDLNLPPTERFDRMNRGFFTDRVNPISSRIDQGKFPGYKVNGGIGFAGRDGLSRSPFDADNKNIQPRLGAAFQLTSNTVLRGGWGLFFLSPTSIGRNHGFSITTPYVATLDSNRTPANRASNPFPSGVLAPAGASLGMQTFLGQGPAFANISARIPYTHQFSFGVQRILPWNVVVEASYVGSRANGMRISKPFNELSLQNLALGDPTKGGDPNFLNQRVPNPFENLIPGTALNTSTIARSQFLRPYPQFTSFDIDDLNDGQVWYNSFQLSVEKRYSHGLTMTAALTLAKNIEALSYLNGQDTTPTRTLTSFDRSYRLVLAPIYELPFGPGRRLLNSQNWLLSRVAGGWQMVATTIFQSGEPMGIPSNVWLIGDPKLDNPGLDQPLFKAGVIDVDGRVRNVAAGEQPVFAIRPPFTLRTTPARYGHIRNRWATTFDFTLAKSFFAFRERLRAQFRAEAFNVLNTPNFSGNPNLTPTSPSFGRIFRDNGQTNEPRVVQLGLRLQF